MFSLFASSFFNILVVREKQNYPVHPHWRRKRKKNDLRNEDKWEELKLEKSRANFILYSGSLKGTVLPRELCSDIRHLPPAIHISITMLPDWLIVTCHWAKARRRQNNLGECRITLPTEILNKTKRKIQMRRRRLKKYLLGNASNVPNSIFIS